MAGRGTDILGSRALLLPEPACDFCLWLLGWKDLLSGAQDRCLESIWSQFKCKFLPESTLWWFGWLVGCRFEASVSLEISHIVSSWTKGKAIQSRFPWRGVSSLEWGLGEAGGTEHSPMRAEKGTRSTGSGFRSNFSILHIRRWRLQSLSVSSLLWAGSLVLPEGHLP